MKQTRPLPDWSVQIETTAVPRFDCRFARPFDWQTVPAITLTDLVGQMRPHVPWQRLVAGVAALLGLLIAFGETSNWDMLLRFLYHVPYGQNDPLYDKDIGFYLFSLPAYVAVKNWMMATLLFATLFVAAIYWAHGDIEYNNQRRSMSPVAIAHGSVLLGIFFAVKAWSYVLDRFLLLYGDNGVVVGASYTDVHVQLPVL